MNLHRHEYFRSQEDYGDAHYSVSGYGLPELSSSIPFYSSEIQFHDGGSWNTAGDKRVVSTHSCKVQSQTVELDYYVMAQNC